MLENLEFEYRGDMTERFMVFVRDKDEGDFREKMLMENRVSGYLPLTVETENEKKLYLYDISGCRSLADYMQEGPVDGKLLKTLLAELEKIFIRGKSFMLEEDNYVLHPDALFFTLEGCLMCAYLPGYEKNIKLQLCELLGYMLDTIDVSDKTSVYYFYTTLVTAREENCTFKTLLAGLEEKKNADPEESGCGEAKAGAEKETNPPALSLNKKPVGKKTLRTLAYAALFAVFAGVMAFFLLF